MVVSFHPRQGAYGDRVFPRSPELVVLSALLSPESEAALWSSLATDLLCDVDQSLSFSELIECETPGPSDCDFLCFCLFSPFLTGGETEAPRGETTSPRSQWQSGGLNPFLLGSPEGKQKPSVRVSHSGISEHTALASRSSQRQLWKIRSLPFCPEATSFASKALAPAYSGGLRAGTS